MAVIHLLPEAVREKDSVETPLNAPKEDVSSNV